MTAPRKQPQHHSVGGAPAEGVAFRAVVVSTPPVPDPPPSPSPPPHRATRSEDECRALARRQRGGEDLGLSDAFVAEWAP